jgi:uncharacterized protein YbcI
MEQFQGNIGHRIACTARAFEQRQTKHGREWVVVFLNEETIVIALHGSLTAVEKAVAQTPIGLAQLREFHRQLFGDHSDALLQKIKSITGMGVRETAAEIDPANGSVVLFLTTDTAAKRFPLPPGGPAEIRAPRHAWPRGRAGSAYHEANQATGFPSRDDRPSFTKRISR